MGLDLSERAYRGQRWAARASLAAAGLAVLVPLAYGGVGGVLLLVAGVVGLGIGMVAVWWTLTLRGPLRWVAGVVALSVPAAVIALFAATLFWSLLASVALWTVAVWSGRYALRGTGSPRVRVMRGRKAAPPRRAVLIMNPRSGGGKVDRFGLKEKAERLGAEVVLLDPEEHQDVTALARKAVSDGADLLGVAGGDGTQALVAAVAAAYDIPFLVISAGTRNHFAMDLGLDREDPAACLDALVDGVELRVDLGFASGRPFVNNASFGAYAAIVQSPGYRDDKIGTSLELLPDLLTRQQGPLLTVRVAGTTLEAPHAVLVSNNPYRTDDPFGLGRRDRLDAAVLGVLGIRVDSAAEAAALLLDPAPPGLSILTATEVVVDADLEEIEAGIDGEALVLPTPVHIRITSGAVRMVRPPGAGSRSRPAASAALSTLMPRTPSTPASRRSRRPRPKGSSVR